MFTEEEIEKLAKEYADEVNCSWPSDYSGFVKGFKKGFKVSQDLNAKNYELIRDIYGVLGTLGIGIYIGFSIIKYGSIEFIQAGFFIFGAVFSYIMYRLKKSVYRSIIFPVIAGLIIGYFVEIFRCSQF